MKSVGSYLKRVQLYEGSPELAELLAGINIDSSFRHYPYNADNSLCDYIQEYIDALEQKYADECVPLTEKKLLARLKATSGNSARVIEGVLHDRWEKEYQELSIEELAVAAKSSRPRSKKHLWLYDQLQAKKNAFRDHLNTKKLSVLRRLKARGNTFGPTETGILDDVLAQREDRRAKRLHLRDRFANEKAEIDAMSTIDLLAISPRRWWASKQAKRYRMKVIRERAVSSAQVADLVGVDWWHTDTWINEENLDRHHLGATQVWINDRMANEKFYDPAILVELETTAAYLAQLAVRTGKPLPPEQHRRMMLNGMKDPENRFVAKYVAFLKQYEKATGAA